MYVDAYASIECLLAIIIPCLMIILYIFTIDLRFKYCGNTEDTKMEDNFPLTHLMSQVIETEMISGYCDHVLLGVLTLQTWGTKTLSLDHELMVSSLEMVNNPSSRFT